MTPDDEIGDDGEFDMGEEDGFEAEAPRRAKEVEEGMTGRLVGYGAAC